MALYEYTCEQGHITEEFRDITKGPAPTVCPECGTNQRTVYQPSLIVFGDFIIGDDDFSRRYHLNGEAGRNGGKPNRTQGQTNVNPLIRQWGKKGRPLEMNKDIDPKKMWNPNTPPPGVDPNTVAPVELQSSDARGLKLNEQ